MLSDDGLMRLAAKQAIASNPKILWVLLGLKFMRSMVSRQKALVPLTTWLLGSWLLAFVALAQVEDAQPGSTSQTDKDRLPEAGLADQAFWNSRQAQGIQPILRTWSAPTTWSFTRKKLDEQQRVFLVKVAKDLETQARFESAVAALKLHYGIAACTMGLEIQSQAESYLNEQIAVEKELIQLGGQVDDTTLLKRTALELKDQRVELETKRLRLQEELSSLVGSDLACNYHPRLVCVPSPELHERCDYEQWAIHQRIELRILQTTNDYLETINQETIDTLGALFSFPGSLLSLWSIPHRNGLLAHKPSSESLAAKRCALKNWTESRVQRIRLDVGLAYAAKESSWQRWQLAVDISNTLQERFEQLKELSEVKGNLPQQIQTKLQLFQAQAIEIQRWLQWHLDDCDLQQATGRIGYWNLEPNSCVDAAKSFEDAKTP